MPLNGTIKRTVRSAGCGAPGIRAIFIGVERKTQPSGLGYKRADISGVKGALDNIKIVSVPDKLSGNKVVWLCFFIFLDLVFFFVI